MDKHEKERLLQKIYIRSFRKDRSTAAYALDSIAVYIIAGTVIYAAVRARFANRTVSALAALSCFIVFTVMLRFLHFYRLERHISKLREQARARIRKYKLIMNIDSLIDKNMLADCYICASAESVTSDDVIEAYRSKKKKLISAARPTESAEELMGYIGIAFISAEAFEEETYPNCLPDVTDEEIDDEIIRTGSAKKPKSAKALLGTVKLLSGERTVRLFCTGALLTLLSFALKNGYSLYYRIIGSLCIALAGAAFGFDSLKSRAAGRDNSDKS